MSIAAKLSVNRLLSFLEVSHYSLFRRLSYEDPCWSLLAVLQSVDQNYTTASTVWRVQAELRSCLD